MNTPHVPIEGDPRAPHAPHAAPALANLAAVQRARSQATVVTCVGAIVPTVLAMQGMASLAIDLLGFPVPVAVALAGFLELALISFALLTRASALAGRPGGIDAAAVWGVSLVSGILAGTHELVGPQVDGVRSWEVDPGSLLAAGVRLAAPLVAALLWERVLTAARREHEARSLVEVRRDRRLIAVAQDALTVRQMEANAPRRLPGQSRTQAARLRLARRKLRRSHIAALRMVGPGTDLHAVLAAVGAVDILPAATMPPGRPDIQSDEGVGPVSRAVHLSDALSDLALDTRTTDSVATRLQSDRAAASMNGLDADPVLPLHRSDTEGVPAEAAAALSDGAKAPDPDQPGLAFPLSDTVDRRSDTQVGRPSDSPAEAVTGQDPLTIAVDLVRHDRTISGARIAVVMREHGHTVTDRTGLRWRDRATVQLDTEATTLREDNVRLVAAAS
jgi:hypothetical protein